ncbi:MAG: nucleotidyltransferase family protein, partial [Gammaproteobacteria bacterium]
MKAMILAAGLGKRLRPLTNTIPKPNLMVGNKSLIQRNIELLIQNGFDEIVINVFHLKSLVKDHVISMFPNTKITFSDEVELLGTGGGVKQALNYLGDESFLLINADICHEFKLDTL